MSRFDDLFDKTPPPEHLARVERAVAPYLLGNKQSSRKRMFIFLGASLTAAMSVLLFIRPVMKPAGDEVAGEWPLELDFIDPEEMDLLADMDSLDAFTDEEFDLILESLQENDDANI
jgi:hypothetical protein